MNPLFRLSRRGLLRQSAAACFSFGAPLWTARVARAEVVVFTLTAIALAKHVIDAQAKTGDLNLELDALNIKLDRVLHNQALLINSIGQVNSNIDRLRSLIVSLPAETVGLEIAADLGGLSDQLIDVLQALTRNKQDKAKLDQYRVVRARLLTLGYKLKSLALQSSRPPALAYAAHHALVSLRLCAKFETRLSIGDGSSKTDLRNLNGIILETFQLLVTNNGSNADGLVGGYNGAQAQIKILNDIAFSSSFAPYSLKLNIQSFRRDVFLDQSNYKSWLKLQRMNIAEPVKNETICFYDRSAPVTLGSVEVIGNDGRTPNQIIDRVYTDRHDFRSETYPLIIRQHQVFGGDSVFEVEHPGKAMAKSWSTTTKRSSEGEIFDSEDSDPGPRRTSGCSRLPELETKEGEIFSQYQEWLAKVNSYRASAGRLLQLRVNSYVNIDICRNLEKFLAA